MVKALKTILIALAAIVVFHALTHDPRGSMGAVRTIPRVAGQVGGAICGNGR